ncbi:PREDICTED: neural proliferation differentiation and control protein 1 isoform X2 [Nanorana parkeri]|uniref:neural proliferation differentiation and control protein 1 isoform X2 n=1 Tax=Nanorana parkeri TaxID=125878 RepID=UPI000854B0D1|nr:PREDICTED: neural proliferation differentiation and control protein 1 isoform X2 [Nanorana parkeri]
MVVVGVLVLLVAATVDSRCPSKLDCVLLMREPCTPGSIVCGPCRHLYEETQTGRCIFKGSRTKFTGPDSVIDIIQEYRLTKGHRIISTDIVSVTTTNTAASAQATSQEMKPPNLHNATLTRSPSPAAATFAPQLKVRNMGRRRKSEMNQSMSLALTVICSLTAVSGLLVAALCWYRLQKEVRLAQEMTYKGNHHQPCKMSAAHMSHYVQQYSSQKKQFKAQECPEKKPCQQLSTDSEADIEEFAIYECPGLAPTGEMEIHNPLFDPSRTKQ